MALHVLNLGQLGQFSFWILRQARIESYGINWQSIIFIAGMMTMVEGLGAVGFFRWLCLYLGRLVNYQVVPILIVFTLLSGFLSMFISSITVLLFLSSVTIGLADPAFLHWVVYLCSRAAGNRGAKDIRQLYWKCIKRQHPLSNTYYPVAFCLCLCCDR